MFTNQTSPIDAQVMGDEYEHYDLESYGIVVTIIPDREEELDSFYLFVSEFRNQVSL